jgi:hypothetical protein
MEGVKVLFPVRLKVEEVRWSFKIGLRFNTCPSLEKGGERGKIYILTSRYFAITCHHGDGTLSETGSMESR